MLCRQRLHQAVNNTFDYSVSVFPTFYPFTITSFPGFLIFSSYQQLTVILACMYWVSCDALFLQITTHICLQFTMQAHYLDDVIANANTYGNGADLKHQLRDIVKKHNELFAFCYEVQMFFNPVIFLTILSNGINLCCCLYQMDQQLVTHEWAEITKNMFHLCSLIIQTLVFCGYAENMTQSSIQMGYSAYHSQWIELNKETKLMLLLIIMRTTKQYNFTVYGMLSLNLNRVTMVCILNFSDYFEQRPV
uniref:Olfactory receptor 96 n=1 Tax=Meteorus pulchricornis TaxID=51522 RepID=A0A1S5VFU3_9HYME|nr:olfactory receptor 96 [Meteorus pulchricornis]